MPLPPEPAVLKAALERFRAFFDELRGVFVERDDVLTQIGLALLAREHVLMTGPPGTGKSALASAVIGRIPDERTGRPSVFARQVTESTVQTDLVGPIDFKTLMGSGRTEHFTDEGMLGSVHAFLDEVLDGRDMLLRSTLNLLQERELKQGQRIERGAIECALMTTNRYLSDVLTHSRDTLLAFVDRVAFVSFVPRGFADQASLEQVLTTMVSRRGLSETNGHSGLSCRLTVQDLDVLQQAVDAVEVPPALMRALSGLLRDFDRGIHELRAADPTFVPTRYLSVRTAVRLGKLLRAVRVFQLAHGATGPLRADHGDLGMLRMALVLTGPTPSEVKALLAAEPDPDERRQLEILRREREIFDECLASVRAIPPAPPAPEIDLSGLREQVRAARHTAGPERLTEAVIALAQAVASNGEGVGAAQALLQQTLDELLQRVVAFGLGSEQLSAAELDAGLLQLARVAEQLEAVHADLVPTARFLRSQVVAMIDRVIASSPAPLGPELAAEPPSDVEAAIARAEAIPQRAEQLRGLREHMLGAGATVADSTGALDAWACGGQRLAEQLSPAWDAALQAALARVLSDGQTLGVADTLSHLQPVLARIHAAADRLDQLAGPPGRAPEGPGRRLLQSVIGGRLGPIVQLAIGRLQSPDRLTIGTQVDDLLDHLHEAGARTGVRTQDLLVATAAVLLRDEPAPPVAVSTAHDLASYRGLRRREARASGTFVLLEVAVRGATLDEDARLDPELLVERGFSELAALPPDLAEAIAGHDLARVERALSFLEGWWTQLSERADLAAMAGSGFFQVCFDEEALRRFQAELGLVARAFSITADATDALTRRLEALTDKALASLASARSADADDRWRALREKSGA